MNQAYTAGKGYKRVENRSKPAWRVSCQAVKEKLFIIILIITTTTTITIIIVPIAN